MLTSKPKEPNIQEFLTAKGFAFNDFLSFDEGDKQVILSTSYKKKSMLIVIDHDAIFETAFEYKRYCQKQNEWMLEFDSVYRFVESDMEMFKQFLGGNTTAGFVAAEVNYEREISYSESIERITDGLVNESVENDYKNAKTFNREGTAIDPSPLEYFFENRFIECYGDEGLKRILREYSIILQNGKTGYIDYILSDKEGKLFAIEENGIKYHHPYLIKEAKYKAILMKQNSVVNRKGKMFRWDSESIRNPEKIDDEIKEFFGDIKQYSIQTYISAKREFHLYKHQEDQIEGLSILRENNNTASLVVLPTGTGKTQIALEDLASFKLYQPKLKALVLVPSLALKHQWIARVKEEKGLIDCVEVDTYAGIYNRYYMESAYKYSYIIVDEAHHAVAPTLAKVIKHYQPEFLLGLTATDKRLDERKLESVFGQYEVSLDLKEAIKKGILCQIRAFRLQTNVDLSEVRFGCNEYYASDLERNILVPSRNLIIAETIAKYFGDRGKLPGINGIVFCVNIKHSKDMAKRLGSLGVNAEAIDGTDPKRFEKIERYMNREISFLCTCSLLTEGWDAPHTSVIVMARPTLSKVLYTQQLGRGTRTSPGKEALYIIDVVDNYGAFGNIMNRPWSAHALLEYGLYSPFGDLVARDGDKYSAVALLDTIYEEELKLAPIDIFTFQQKYGNHLSVEQLARELFVSTGTINSWIQKKKIIPDVDIKMGNRKLQLFDSGKINDIRSSLGLKEHTEHTIVEDFWQFIEENDYTFSYKMYFISALLKTVDSTGEADIDLIAKEYQNLYIERFNSGLAVDRKNCPYMNIEYLNDESEMKRSMITNPFEKFERKRFFYNAKDLKSLSIHHRIWEDLQKNEGMLRLKNKMSEDLEKYYKAL
jgi:superfamily II DNA or RNA helicase